MSKLLHAHGAYSFWDYAAAGPYVEIDMNAPDGAHKDAAFISCHKFIGGPGTPGILVAKKWLFKNTVPTTPGGGTVAYVNQYEHVYLRSAACDVLLTRCLREVEHREEGGTPAIVESIRAGLVFQLKDAVGTDVIRSVEEQFVRRAIDVWSKTPHLRILGSTRVPRVSIVSFVIEHEKAWLHHNFVVGLLNDLFGVQSRGGCNCAGPYGHRLLGISDERSHEFKELIEEGYEGVKPVR